MGSLLPAAHAQRDGIQHITLVRRDGIRRRAAVVHTRAVCRNGAVLRCPDLHGVVIGGSSVGCSEYPHWGIDVIHMQDNAVPVLLQRIVHTVYSNLIFIRIYGFRYIAHRQGNTAQRIVIIRCDRKTDIRSFAHCAAAVLDDIHACPL